MDWGWPVPQEVRAEEQEMGQQEMILSVEVDVVQQGQDQDGSGIHHQNCHRHTGHEGCRHRSCRVAKAMCVVVRIGRMGSQEEGRDVGGMGWIEGG